MKKKIYLANSLFSEADFLYNEILAKEIRKLEKFDLYVPQENESINEKTKSATSRDIFNGDINELESADILLAVLDSNDFGVGVEIGWFAALKKYKKPNLQILALFSDSREPLKTFSCEKVKAMRSEICESQFIYINSFAIGTIKENGGIIFSSKEEIIQYLKNN